MLPNFLFKFNEALFCVVVEGLNKEEAQKHLSRGNQLLNAGQLAEALTHYHAAIG